MRQLGHRRPGSIRQQEIARDSRVVCFGCCWSLDHALPACTIAKEENHGTEAHQPAGILTARGHRVGWEHHCSLRTICPCTCAGTTASQAGRAETCSHRGAQAGAGGRRRQRVHHVGPGIRPPRGSLQEDCRSLREEDGLQGEHPAAGLAARDQAAGRYHRRHPAGRGLRDGHRLAAAVPAEGRHGDGRRRLQGRRRRS